jgi:FAD/FMN-containing dehydrogenase
MARFRDLVHNEEEGTIEFGAGLTWTDLFSYLVPKGLNVVGGRVYSVGVAGFILGGGRHSSSFPPMHCVCSTLYPHVAGYSWKTNQYGLTIDTVTAFELVLPNGTLKRVTEKDEDLWFALRVGPTVSLNNRNIGLTVISRED